MIFRYQYIFIAIIIIFYTGCKDSNQIELEAAIDQFEYLKKQSPTPKKQIELLKSKFESLANGAYSEKETPLYYLSKISLIQNKFQESYKFINDAYNLNHSDSIYNQKEKIYQILNPIEDTLMIKQNKQNQTIMNIIDIGREEIKKLYKNKKYDEAINQTTMIIKMIKNIKSEQNLTLELSQLYQDLAIFYAQKNNTEEAKKMIDMALKLNPTEQNKEIKKLIYKED